MFRAFLLALAAVGVSSLPQSQRQTGAVAVGFGLYGYGTKIGGFALNRVNDDVFLNKTTNSTVELFTINTSSKTISDAKTGDYLAIPTTPGPITLLPQRGAKNTSFKISDMRLFGNTLYFVSASGQLETAWTAVPIDEEGAAFRLEWNVTSDGAVPIALRITPPGVTMGTTQSGTTAAAVAPAS
ncbi:uncharacterized protein PgNI_02171 [Pyricularia grisea]|uniref:Uncharacterized protein n=1 Tax=Pyricularia grisea TaxID=148305 RepID=A0A6P8BIQ5_PYRGI|nr:uncharacterized protein PgNI_02171 [Pyricularia grisea]TLD16653.1 hypothetical protein PgNI_02171 [Pyricularia grisea]